MKIPRIQNQIKQFGQIVEQQFDKLFFQSMNFRQSGASIYAKDLEDLPPFDFDLKQGWPSVAKDVLKNQIPKNNSVMSIRKKNYYKSSAKKQLRINRLFKSNSFSKPEQLQSQKFRRKSCCCELCGCESKRICAIVDIAFHHHQKIMNLVVDRLKDSKKIRTKKMEETIKQSFGKKFHLKNDYDPKKRISSIKQNDVSQMAEDQNILKKSEVNIPIRCQTDISEFSIGFNSEEKKIKSSIEKPKIVWQIYDHSYHQSKYKSNIYMSNLSNSSNYKGLKLPPLNELSKVSESQINSGKLIVKPILTHRNSIKSLYMKKGQYKKRQNEV